MLISAFGKATCGDLRGKHFGQSGQEVQSSLPAAAENVHTPDEGLPAGVDAPWPRRCPLTAPTSGAGSAGLCLVPGSALAGCACRVGISVVFQGAATPPAPVRTPRAGSARGFVAIATRVRRPLTGCASSASRVPPGGNWSLNAGFRPPPGLPRGSVGRL
jgi:hypothetical protein